MELECIENGFCFSLCSYDNHKEYVNQENFLVRMSASGCGFIFCEKETSSFSFDKIIIHKTPKPIFEKNSKIGKYGLCFEICFEGTRYNVLSYYKDDAPTKLYDGNTEKKVAHLFCKTIEHLSKNFLGQLDNIKTIWGPFCIETTKIN